MTNHNTLEMQLGLVVRFHWTTNNGANPIAETELRLRIVSVVVYATRDVYMRNPLFDLHILVCKVLSR